MAGRDRLEEGRKDRMGRGPAESGNGPIIQEHARCRPLPNSDQNIGLGIGDLDFLKTSSIAKLILSRYDTASEAQKVPLSARG